MLPYKQALAHHSFLENLTLTPVFRLVLAIALHVGAYVVAKQEIGPAGLQFLGVVWTFTGLIGYAVLPLFVGWIGRLHRATSIPRS